jgi:large repetitive protein
MSLLALTCLIMALVCLPGMSRANLLGYWTFEEGTGTLTADMSGNGYDGTLSGGTLPGWVTPGAVGSGALEFYGSGSTKVSIGNPAAFQLTGAVTLAAWVNPDSVSTSGKIVSKLSSTRGYSISVENITSTAGQGQWTFQLSPTGGSSLISCRTPNDAPAIGQWTHIAGVFDPNDSGGPSMKIYLNGQLAYTTNSTAVPAQQVSSANNVTIGSRPDSVNPFDGKIDEVRIYDEALSASQILALVPEPSTISLGVAMMALLGVRRFARRA